MVLKYYHFLVIICLLSSALKASTGFLFFGDFGINEPDQRAVAKGMETYCGSHTGHSCQFVLTLGDNFYPSGVQSVTDSKWKTHFLDIYQKLGLTFYASLGNHDYGGKIQAEIDYTKSGKLWYMPARYYSFSKNDVEFFAIDTETFDEQQQAWLQQKIGASKASWKIAYGHQPIYSYGMHGESNELIKKLLPIIEGKVDFYLSGHDHDLQVLSDHGAPLFVVSGAAAQTRPTKTGARTEFASSELGFAHLQIEKTSAKLEILNKLGDVKFNKTITKP